MKSTFNRLGIEIRGTVSLLILGLGCSPRVHMVSAIMEPIPNWTTVHVIGYGKTVSTLLL